MTDDLRWAVRYAFLEDLWRDRARVIVDAGLEAALRAGARPGGEPVDELVDALVPRVPKARTWVAVADESVARQLAQTRPGTGFLPRSSFADVVAHRDWAVALVELSALDDRVPGGTRLREQLAERAREGRTVLVSVRATPPEAEGEEDPGFAALYELVDEVLGGGRVFGVYRPPMAAVVDFGADDDDDDAAEVPLSFDNTLGTQAPHFVEYVAVAGEHPPLPEGMTLVELPADAGPVEPPVDDGLRERLLQAQRQAELAAIDRQALLEKVDELESARQRLEQQAGGLRDELARVVTEQEPEVTQAAQRLDATLADNQALRWKVQQLERELDAARARPVEALEAEAAALRAESEALRAESEALRAQVAALQSPPQPTQPTVEPTEGAAEPPDDAAEPMSYAVEATEDAADAVLDEAVPLELSDDGRLEGMGLETLDAAERLRFGAALADLDRLLTQVERGGIGALPLRQALVALRRRLRG